MDDKNTHHIHAVPAQAAKQIADMIHDLCSMARVQGYITHAEILEAAEALVAGWKEGTHGH